MGMAEDGGTECFPAGWSVAAKVCDYCKLAGAVLFCRSESAFMCMVCDVRVHGGGASGFGLRHERVWMCEVCEQVPASVTCKADAAALCVTCDRDIHSANPLSRRHERVPVVPFFDAAESIVKSSPAADDDDDQDGKTSTHVCDKDFDSAWIFPSVPAPPTTSITPPKAQDMKSMEFLLSDNSDQLIDFDYSMSFVTRCYPYNGAGTDSVVPVQPISPPVQVEMVDHSPEKQFEIDFTRSNLNSYSKTYSAASLSHSVSSSSLDVGVVPDGSSVSEISYPFGRSVNSGLEMGGTQASQLVVMDREARVLRYREKRKNRKFEKTIRYASRKAYAETRPRIKGRFAKRTEIDINVDQIFSSATLASFMADSGRYGVVPTF